VGLKHADATSVFDAILKEEPMSTANVHLHGIQAQISKFLVLRDRNQREHTSYYERSLIEEGRRSLSQPTMCVASLENEKLAKSQKLYLLRKQLDVVSSTIHVQTNFLQLVKTSMEVQLRTQADIITLISQLDPSYTSSLRSNNIEQQQILSSLPVQTQSIDTDPSPLKSSSTDPLVAPQTSRLELQIISEMRTHMDLHRQLLLRKEDQVSQFSHISSSSSTVPPPVSSAGAQSAPVIKQEALAPAASDAEVTNDWIWDDEHMDEHLFDFLSAIPPSTSSSN
jgi:hypothetical protein